MAAARSPEFSSSDPQPSASRRTGRTPPAAVDVVPQRRHEMAILVSRGAGIFTAALGGSVLAGWLLGVPLLTIVVPGQVSMKANAALALLIAGMGLTLRVAPDSWIATPLRRQAAALCGLAVALIGAITVLEYATGLDLRVDQVFVMDTFSQVRTSHPGRMGLNTALVLVASGLAILLLDWRIEARRLSLANVLALVTGWTTLMVFFGYAYSVQSLRGLGSFTEMALPTAVGFGALSLGLLAARPGKGVVALMLTDGLGSAMARRLLPAVVLIPFFLGWVRLKGQAAGLYDTEMGVAILTAANVALLGIVVLTAAASLNRIDRDRRAAIEKVVASEERMDFALQAGGVGVWDADLHAGTVVWSGTHEAIHGLSPGGFRGTFEAFLECIHPEDREAARTAIEAALQPEHSPRLEYRTIWPDGSTHWIVGRGRPVGINTEGASRVIGIGIDITERRQLEDQLRQAQKMEAIGQLAGGVAHDFNNLLTVILGFAELLREDLASNDPALEGVSEIRKAADRATSLTQQLLAFSRRQILQPTVLNVNAVVTSAGEMLRRLIPATIALKICPGDHLRHVRADVTQLEQVLLNLVVNARDAMPHGGTLTIETTNVTLDEVFARRHGVAPVAPGPFVMIAVSDTGVGMDSETQKRIFEPFFTTKPAGRGTGLGLATVFGIVKQSDGFVWVYSEEGKGTTFKVYLPAVDTVPQVRDESSAHPEAGPRGEETVLLAEDEESVRLLARTLLERCGYRVLDAATPAIAEHVSAHETGPIHLLVTDIVMPGSSGPELFARIAGLRPALRVLYMSGYADGAVIELGAPFIQKPFSAMGFTRKVREVLDA